MHLNLLQGELVLTLQEVASIGKDGSDTLLSELWGEVKMRGMDGVRDDTGRLEGCRTLVGIELQKTNE